MFTDGNKMRQGYRGDMRKIHVTRQFFEGSGRHGDLIEKTKNGFLDKVNRSMCAKFQVCIIFVWPGDVTHINK